MLSRSQPISPQRDGPGRSLRAIHPLFVAANPVRPEVAIAQGTRVHIYDIGSGVEAIPALEEPLGNQVADLAWSPDGTMLAGLSVQSRNDIQSMGQTDL